MKLRFQTRLTIAIALVAAVSVLVLSVVLLAVDIGLINAFFATRGMVLTKLVMRSVKQNMQLPDTVMRRVGEQMTVSALLAADLVAEAEKNHNAPEAVSAMLRDVIERSKQVAGYPLVDEFWVTDEQGLATIHTDPEGFDFNTTALPAQTKPFLTLLDPGADPVIQETQPRARDKKLFKYAGVTGVDKPRIVQVGVGEELIHAIEKDFLLERNLEQFVTRSIPDKAFTPPEMRQESGEQPDTDIDCIAVTDSAGKILAMAESESRSGLIPDKEYIGHFCMEFLRSNRGFAIEQGDMVFRVATMLGPRSAPESKILFMQHRIEPAMNIVRSRIHFIIAVSVAMIVFALAISYWLGRRLLRPLMRLEESAHAFGRGELDHRIEVCGDCEFAAVAEAFNTMAGTLNQHIHDLAEATRRRESLESELRIAATLQQSLLPERAPQLPGIEIAGFSRPAREVGGDFFDYFDLGRGRIGIALGDGTGKGLPAAMLVAECGSVLSALASEERTPAELLRRMNTALFHRFGASGQFITLFFLILDPDERRLYYSTAGHNPPLLAGEEAGRMLRLESDMGFPLGIFDDSIFGEHHVALEPGDTILIYSDGLTEAQAPDGSLYGEARLRAWLETHRGLAAQELIDALQTEVDRFQTGEQADDFTAVAVRIWG